jgi:cation diffusion facilitator CzcD-associated flavoprotein CzcO
MTDTRGQETDARADVVIVGAGIAGLYQLHRLRGLGLSVTLIEAGSGVGGVWFWNRYPGARLDSESYTYGYFFSEEIFRDWRWSEEFVGQPELERYFNFVADRLDLRRDIVFNARLDAARFDEAAREWNLTLADGRRMSCRFLITALGILSAPYFPPIAGRERFRGPQHHTGLWPAEGVDLAGKRVAVIGTGSSGVQFITEVAPQVAQLLVFQRTANWCMPLNNRKISPEGAAEIHRDQRAIYDRLLAAPNGYIHGECTEAGADATEDERRRHLDRLWGMSGLRFFTVNYRDMLVSREVNASISAYLAERIRARVKDPALAEKLIPKDHGFAMKRPPLDSGYYEAYNRDNVTLIDASDERITSFDEAGIITTGSTYEVDVIVFATGFDALTGALERVDIRGPSGASLKEHWEAGARTHLGLFSHGFPNLFMVNGPQGPTGNNPRTTEFQVNFVTACLEHMQRQGLTRIEASAAAEADWTARVVKAAAGTLLDEAQNWIMGSNIPGKARTPLQFMDGLRAYRSHCTGVQERGFEGLGFG